MPIPSFCSYPNQFEDIPMDKQYCFVNGPQVDMHTRRMMRRHVMMGKNAGKTIQRKSRREKLPSDSTTTVTVACLHGSRIVGKKPQSNLASSMPAGIDGRTLAGLSFPVKVTPHFAEVISTFFVFVANRLYPSVIGISLDVSKCNWLRVLMSDKAAFYCNIALMQACNELFLGEGESSPAAMYHLSNSLKYVRERLKGSEALSDSTMGIVMSLIVQEQIRNQHETAKIHMDGLVRMIELRGGLESLRGALPVLLKACKTDIMFTLQHEETPRFYRDKMEDAKEALKSQGLYFDRKTSIRLVQHPDIDPTLLDVLLDVTCLCTLFNDLPVDKKVDLYLFQEILISICYRLLAIPFYPIYRSTPTMEDAYHIGLTLFMMSSFLHVKKQRALNYENLIRRLKYVIQRGNTEGELRLKLWLLIVGGVWVAEGPDAEWLLQMVRDQAKIMGLKGWVEAKEAMRGYPWIWGLHDEHGMLTWEKACGDSRP